MMWGLLYLQILDAHKAHGLSKMGFGVIRASCRITGRGNNGHSTVRDFSMNVT